MSGQHALIDFAQSILDDEQFTGSGGAPLIRRHGSSAPTFRDHLGRLASTVFSGTNQAARFYAHVLLELIKAESQVGGPLPRLLIIGGGEIGSGADELYGDTDVELIGTDIYASANTDLLADAHCLPFADESLDAVWIQAVLEHVLSPEQAVAEIHRVLKPSGLVFADTPFLWPVHEQAFDFCRFTASGHRWLFRCFELLAAGQSSGAGQNLILAVRCALAALLRSGMLGSVFAAPVFGLRFLDRLGSKRGNLDAAAGLFFLGRKSTHTLTPREIVAYYEEQTRLQPNERPRARR